MTSESLRDHEEQQAKHAFDVEENELHKETGKERHAQHDEHEKAHEDAKFKEKGARRGADVRTAELAEEINSELRDEE